MKDDPHGSSVPVSRCDGMSLPARLVLLMSPFSLFRNTNRGDLFARAAAYRHNREMRVYLPGYLMRWSFGAVLVLALMAAAESLAGSLEAVSPLLMVVAAAFGLAFTASVCVLFVTAYVYVYLSRNE